MTSVPKKDSKKNEGINYVNLYESEGKVYTRKVSGFFQSVRRYSVLPLVIGYILLPWIMLDGRPAVLFDLPARQFHVLWITFWPQDFVLLAGLLIIAAFGLFTVTALFGRVWCGFTCPQTAWTLMFISIERIFEGSRNQQIKLDGQGWSANKVLRKSGKHATWLLVGFITGLTFVGYFVPIRDLILGLLPHRDEYGMVKFGAHPVAIFWILFFTFMTYLNAGWLRVQVCKYMCPYARFQSVMYDSNTLAVHYDVERGEPRGGRKLGEKPQDRGLGDCTDCSWCVQVCPVDIDIRDGLQYECINCGLCVDACNSVMDKMSYPRGLIRYTSENALQKQKHKLIRPRLIVYFAVLSILVSVFAYRIISREPISIDVSRDRGLRLYRVKGDEIQNVYTVKVYNMDEKSHQYELWVNGDEDFKLAPYRPINLEKGGKATFPVRVLVDKKSLKSIKSTVEFHIKALTPNGDDAMTSMQKIPFYGPSQK